MTLDRTIEKLSSCSIVPFCEDDCEAAQIAITALREKQERDKGCATCKKPSMFLRQHNLLYCPMCGRKLEENKE